MESWYAVKQINEKKLLKSVSIFLVISLSIYLSISLSQTMP